MNTDFQARILRTFYKEVKSIVSSYKQYFVTIQFCLLSPLLSLSLTSNLRSYRTQDVLFLFRVGLNTHCIVLFTYIRSRIIPISHRFWVAPISWSSSYLLLQRKPTFLIIYCGQSLLVALSIVLSAESFIGYTGSLFFKGKACKGLIYIYKKL